MEQARYDQLHADYEQSQADVRLSFRRIAEMQALLDDELHDDSTAEFHQERSFTYYIHFTAFIFQCIHGWWIYI